MPYKYANTWVAINAALDKSKESLSQYNNIEQIVRYMRTRASDRDMLDWNLVICASYEMQDDPKSPIWNHVMEVFANECSAEDKNKWERVNRVARQLTREES